MGLVRVLITVVNEVHLGVSVDERNVIQSVDEGSLAELQNTLQVGDRILAIDGVKIKQGDDAAAILGSDNRSVFVDLDRPQAGAASPPRPKLAAPPIKPGPTQFASPTPPKASRTPGQLWARKLSSTPGSSSAATDTSAGSMCKPDTPNAAPSRSLARTFSWSRKLPATPPAPSQVEKQPAPPSGGLASEPSTPTPPPAAKGKRMVRSMSWSRRSTKDPLPPAPPVGMSLAAAAVGSTQRADLLEDPLAVDKRRLTRTFSWSRSSSGAKLDRAAPVRNPTKKDPAPSSNPSGGTGLSTMPPTDKTPTTAGSSDGGSSDTPMTELDRLRAQMKETEQLLQLNLVEQWAIGQLKDPKSKATLDVSAVPVSVAADSTETATGRDAATNPGAPSRSVRQTGNDRCNGAAAKADPAAVRNAQISALSKAMAKESRPSLD